MGELKNLARTKIYLFFFNNSFGSLASDPKGERAKDTQNVKSKRGMFRAQLGFVRTTPPRDTKTVEKVNKEGVCKKGGERGGKRQGGCVPSLPNVGRVGTQL